MRSRWWTMSEAGRRAKGTGRTREGTWTRLRTRLRTRLWTRLCVCKGARGCLGGGFWDMISSGCCIEHAPDFHSSLTTHNSQFTTHHSPLHSQLTSLTHSHTQLTSLTHSHTHTHPLQPSRRTPVPEPRYPCGLWFLFHALVANFERDAQGDLMKLRDFFITFFPCPDCADHFAKMSRDIAQVRRRGEMTRKPHSY